MSQPAAKQEPSPANDARYRVGEHGDADSSKALSVAEKRSSRATAENPVKRAVEEFSGLIDEMDDIRQILAAHAIPRRTARMMVEFGVQKAPDKQAAAVDTAMKRARKSLGDGALKREELENYVATLVTLEHDLTHARSVARDEGLDTHALSVVTQMIQQNPGDGGSKAANTLIAYIAACGIETDKTREMLDDLVKKSTSVLPQIPRKSDKPSINVRKSMIQDVLVGLFIGVAVIWALL